eukprot:2081604-Rhodomonas_salina.3
MATRYLELLSVGREPDDEALLVQVGVGRAMADHRVSNLCCLHRHRRFAPESDLLDPLGLRRPEPTQPRRIGPARDVLSRHGDRRASSVGASGRGDRCHHWDRVIAKGAAPPDLASSTVSHKAFHARKHSDTRTNPLNTTREGPLTCRCHCRGCALGDGAGTAGASRQHCGSRRPSERAHRGRADRVAVKVRASDSDLGSARDRARRRMH